jgi:hypothetical protein
VSDDPRLATALAQHEIGKSGDWRVIQISAGNPKD